MELKEIRLDSVKDLMSNGVYNTLINNNILTVGDVLSFPLDFFAALKGVGLGRVWAYKKFQSIINVTPDIVIKTYKKTLPSVISEKIKNIKIASLGKLMHKQVLTLLLSNGILKVKDLDSLSVEMFQSSGKKKAQRYAEFLAIVFNKPELILQASSDYLPVILPSEPQVNDFFGLFSLFIKECYEVRFRHAVSFSKKKGIEKKAKIILNYYGIADYSSKALNVSEVSEMFDEIALERVRQIIKIEIDYFRELLTHGKDKGNNIIISESLLSFYRKLNERLPSKVYAENLLCELLRSEYFNFEVNSKEYRYLVFFLDILGFKLETTCKALLKNESVFIKTLKLRYPFKKRYFDLSLSVFKYLRKEVLSVNINTLFVEMSKNFDCSLEEVLAVCENSSFVENLSVGDTYIFQIKFYRLSSCVDMAYRVLKEGEAKPVTRHELARMINERLNKEGGLVTEIKGDVLATQLAYSKRFKSRGRKSWVLKEWGVNVDIVRHVLLKCFEIEKKPLSISELHDLVLNVYKRDDISIDIVRYFLQRPHFNSIPCDGGLKYIAKEYVGDYSDLAALRKLIIVDWRLVLDILHKNPDSRLRDLYTHCKRANVNVSFLRLSGYLSNNHYVKISNEGARSYSVVSNYAELYEDDEQNKPKNKVKVFILELLDERGGKSLLIDIVKFCKARHGIPKAFSYRLVGKMEDESVVLKKVIDGKNYLIKL